MGRSLGRIYTTDVPLPARDSGNVIKTRIAAFSGAQFLAEREGDELIIYQLTDDEGVSRVKTLTGDIKSVADLSRRARHLYRGNDHG